MVAESSPRVLQELNHRGLSSVQRSRWDPPYRNKESAQAQTNIPYGGRQFGQHNRMDRGTTPSRTTDRSDRTAQKKQGLVHKRLKGPQRNSPYLDETKLGVGPGAHLVRQKMCPLRAERKEPTEAEIEKLLRAHFISPV